MEMLENNNLAFVIAATVPALYSILVWSATPKSAVKWKVATMYFIMGTLSAWFISFFHWVFPQWDNSLSQDAAVAAFLLAFFQVAVLEESGKYIAFKLTDSYRHRRWPDHPAATMFYAMSVGAGFALVENFMYVARAQELATQLVPMIPLKSSLSQVWELVLVRSTTSMIVHMICGLMLGYFVSLYRCAGSGVTSHWRPIVRKLWFNALGVGCAVMFHGVYDFNLMLDPNASMRSVLTIVIAGLMIAYVLANKMFNKTEQDLID